MNTLLMPTMPEKREQTMTDKSLSDANRKAGAGPWISVDDKLPEVGEVVAVYTPPTEHDWPGSVNIRFDYICPDYEDWHDHAEHFEHWQCVAKPEGSVGPKQKAPYTHWMRIGIPGEALPTPAPTMVDERAAYIAWLGHSFPHVYDEKDAEIYWDKEHVSALAWKARATRPTLQSLGGDAGVSEAEEDAWVIDRLSKLLADVAIALKGEEMPRHRHSFHDLPDVARLLKLELDLYRATFPNGVPESALAARRSSDSDVEGED